MSLCHENLLSMNISVHIIPLVTTTKSNTPWHAAYAMTIQSALHFGQCSVDSFGYFCLCTIVAEHKYWLWNLESLERDSTKVCHAKTFLQTSSNLEPWLKNLFGLKRVKPQLDVIHCDGHWINWMLVLIYVKILTVKSACFET